MYGLVVVMLKAVTRKSTTDQAMPVAPANWLFTRIQLAENRLIRAKVTLPIGSSVFVVAQKNVDGTRTTGRRYAAAPPSPRAAVASSKHG
jgi:hypothetical protein